MNSQKIRGIIKVLIKRVHKTPTLLALCIEIIVSIGIINGGGQKQQQVIIKGVKRQP